VIALSPEEMSSPRRKTRRPCKIEPTSTAAKSLESIIRSHIASTRGPDQPPEVVHDNNELQTERFSLPQPSILIL
jgi:hypothetical protein